MLVDTNRSHLDFVQLRLALIRLGPAFIKLGQTLSTRPDVLPPPICAELAKLQDQIPPFPTRAAFRAIETQLGAPIEKLFQEISPEPIAAASLGQVYKGEHADWHNEARCSTLGNPIKLKANAVNHQSLQFDCRPNPFRAKASTCSYFV